MKILMPFIALVAIVSLLNSDIAQGLTNLFIG